MKTRILFVVLFAAVSCVGCTRGESRSLDEIVVTAKDRLSEAARDSVARVPEGVRTNLMELTSRLEEFSRQSGAGGASAEAADISRRLNALIPLSGYTSRPALTQLATQFAAVGGIEGVAQSNLETGNLKTATTVSTGERQLLVARTFSALASELEGTAFSL